MKKVIRGSLGFAVSLAAVVWFALSVNWGQIGVALMQAAIWPVVPAVALLILQFYFRTIRWRYLLPPAEQVSNRTFFDALMIGSTASCVLPLRAGEFIRPLLLSLQSSYAFAVGLTSVVIERFFDLSAVLLTLGLVLPFLENVPVWVSRGAGLLTAMALGILVLIVVGAIAPAVVRGVATVLTKPLPKGIAAKLNRILDQLLLGAVVLKDAKRVVAIILCTAGVWISTYVLFYVCLWLFAIPATVTTAVTCTVFVALAVAAPSAPGFIGVYHAGCLAALSLFNVDIDRAGAYALVSHIIQILPVIVYGAFALSRGQWGLGELVSRSRAS